MRFGRRRRGEPRTPGESRYYVRAADPADLPAVLAMKLASWREAYGELRDAEFFDRAEATLEQQVEHWAGLQHRGTGIWLAEDLTDRVVGMASLDPGETGELGEPGAPGPAQLTTLYVLAEAQGTGVADALLRAALNHAAPSLTPDPAIPDPPLPDVVLTVLENNPRAIAFYTRHGFEQVGEPIEMTGPWAGLREIRMVRRGDRSW
ncbi:GNAT family N-acetyltransferase [Citricoccus sp. NR2]|uniref:GNAT family N-acetyltransferase n=1 Tax=Citricoccus sp. NR2 TaxID=3004095 RepID=UPI0022DD00FB|nr:N-acetyltransferase [Citricoccus sp. NR2]WBL19579.1 N-acetyltransferase [Citricoccus sp. NR2]